MKTETPPFFVITGPPGSGKTTLIESLEKHVKVVPEAARRVLMIERASGGTATGEQDAAAFVTRMLDMSIADYAAANGPTLFDRGLPDLLAFCTYYQLPDQNVRTAIKAHPYQPPVFMLPSWPEIYQTDSERTLDFVSAAAFGDLTRQAYLRSGYSLVDVPKTSREARLAFILKALKR